MHEIPDLSQRASFSRGIDWLPGPFAGMRSNSSTTTRRDKNWLLTDFEAKEFTGVLKGSHEGGKRRLAVLWHKGLITGCLRTSLARPKSADFKNALVDAVADLGVPGTALSSYELPEAVVRSLSSFFVGVRSVTACPPRIPGWRTFSRDGHSGAIAQRIGRTSVLSLFDRGQFLWCYIPSRRLFVPSLEELEKASESSPIEKEEIAVLSDTNSRSGGLSIREFLAPR